MDKQNGHGNLYLFTFKFPRMKKRKSIDNLIIVESTIISKFFLKIKYCWLFSCVIFAVSQHHLTDAVEMLERLGFCGEYAIFILAQIGGIK